MRGIMSRSRWRNSVGSTKSPFSRIRTRWFVFAASSAATNDPPAPEPTTTMSVSRTRWSDPPTIRAASRPSRRAPWATTRRRRTATLSSVSWAMSNEVDWREIPGRLRRIQQPRTRIAHDLPGHLLVGVDGRRPDELRPGEDVAERPDVAVAQEEEVAIRIVGVKAPELPARGKAIAVGEGAGESRQHVEEVDQELHVGQEHVAAGPGELRIGGDRVVVRILLLELLPDLRVGRIEAVDDLGDDLLLDGG